MSKLAFRAQTVDIAYLPLRQDLLAKNVLMTAQRDFRLGNSPLEDSTFPLDALNGQVGFIFHCLVPVTGETGFSSYSL